MKVIAFPFAGGNENSFNFLKKDLNKKGIKLEVIEYPGRGFRLEEKLLDSVDEIVKDVFDQIKDKLHQDEYIIYGHSMGALIGYLVCRKIEELKLPQPSKLIVSGREAPGVINEEKRCLLPSELFWEKISELGGFPDEILKEKGLRDFFEPILRADFRAIEYYQHIHANVLHIPIDVLYGNKEILHKSDIIEWGTITNKVVKITKLEGDHFFIYDHVGFLVDRFYQSFEKTIGVS
ncbi:thioesterase II family protein [Aquimarina pacifica]|uniref:thioesterase II family protein n=1 Tax=Aquimarina pacifica TaxID=1296415 RepID=UPI0004722063|nr:thioesterase domain-containing protein [Aquimarina pacifica]